MTDKIKSITTNTLIPISTIIVVWYACLWLMDIKARAEISDTRIKIQEENQKQIITKLDLLNDRLYRIEGLITRKGEH